MPWVIPAMMVGGTAYGMYEGKRGKDTLKAGQKRTGGYMHPGLMPGSKSPMTYKTPGGNFSYSGGNVKAAASPFRKYLKRDYDDTRGMMSRTRELGQSIAPGMSQVRAARERAAQNAITKRRGNLQAQMQQRNMSGSAFDHAGRNMLAMDEGQMMGEAGAQSFLDEYDMSMKNIAQEAQLGQQATAQIAKGLEYDLNFMNTIFKGTRDVQDYISNMNQIMSGNASAMAELRSAQAQGFGQLAGVAMGKMPDYA
tara:strand:+ start:17 stop:775 length:759 start_codon:yes stop_codon:yes gene_type:complete